MKMPPSTYNEGGTDTSGRITIQGVNNEQGKKITLKTRVVIVLLITSALLFSLGAMFDIIKLFCATTSLQELPDMCNIANNLCIAGTILIGCSVVLAIAGTILRYHTNKGKGKSYSKNVSPVVLSSDFGENSTNNDPTAMKLSNNKNQSSDATNC